MKQNLIVCKMFHNVEYLGISSPSTAQATLTLRPYIRGTYQCFEEKDEMQLV